MADRRRLRAVALCHLFIGAGYGGGGSRGEKLPSFSALFKGHLHNGPITITGMHDCVETVIVYEWLSLPVPEQSVNCRYIKGMRVHDRACVYTIANNQAFLSSVMGNCVDES